VKTVVICCDRIPLKMIGAYGSEWVETPNLDRLSAEGVVFDSAFCDSVDLCAAVQSRLTETPFVHLDEKAFPDFDSGEAFFAKAAETWDRLPQTDALIWIAVSLHETNWIPPAEWRGRHREDGDAEPIYEHDTVPADESSVQRIVSGWADRIAYFDSMLGAFVQAIEETTEKPIIVFTAKQGEALGEHGFVGVRMGAPYRENAQRPLIVRHQQGPRSVRRSHLMNSDDVAELIVELAQVGALSRLGPQANSERWYVSTWRSLTTARWRLIENAEGDAKLFAVPEDVCEMNDQASRAPAMAHELAAALAVFKEEANDGAG